MTTKQNFASNLRRLRLAAGLSQADLAKRLNCTTAYISHLETERNSVGLGVLEKFAKALCVSPATLLAKPKRSKAGTDPAA